MTNETDRELLEPAAKAAGLNNLIFNHGKTNSYHAGSLEYMTEKHHHTPWNPLNDDGDALRLAVKLRICLGPNLQLDRAVAYAEDDPVQSEPYVPDPYAATRRAIVRAAAEIGRAMK